MTENSYIDSDKFCKQCFIQDTYFDDDACPRCQGVEKIYYKDMSKEQRMRAFIWQRKVDFNRLDSI